MKHVLYRLLSLSIVVVFALTACGGASAPATPVAIETGQEATPAEATEDTGTTPPAATEAPATTAPTEEETTTNTTPSSDGQPTVAPTPAPDPSPSPPAEPEETPEDPSAQPGNGEVVTMARANWDTGWFQAEIFKQLLQELGYRVEGPETYGDDGDAGDTDTDGDDKAQRSVGEFYTDAASGEIVDFWVNGWFPLHNQFMMQEGVQDRVTTVGSQVRGGALQGYLVDKATAERLRIDNLDIFKNPQIAREFDSDGNGKANLIGCDEGWGCEAVIEYHLDAYDLRETVEHVQGDYSQLMQETMNRINRGEPVLFYTWTPNWTVGKLLPGRDVVWIEVPFASLPPDQRDREEATAKGVPGVPGCVNDPCHMGFPPNDILVAANQEFLITHPAINELFKQVQIDLADIARQNSRMVDGEDSAADIERHAINWIANNRAEVDDWLEAARASGATPPPVVEAIDILQRVKDRGQLRCGVREDLPGFSYSEDNERYSGFHADFCRVIATAIFSDSERVEFVLLTPQESFPAVSDQQVDVLIDNTTWIAIRDMGGMDSPFANIRLDFGPTIFHDGQGFMAHASRDITSLADLEDKSICVQAESTQEQTLNEYFEEQDMNFILAPFDTIEEVYQRYEDGLCDAVTGDKSELASRRVGFENPDDHILLETPISREPKGPVFIEDDSQWRDVVSWAIFATIYAEELGVTSENVAIELESGDPDVERLLGVRGQLGESIGLDNGFARAIIEQVGNYEEIYERNLGPETPLELERGPNKVWNKGEGGVLNAPPFR